MRWLMASDGSNWNRRGRVRGRARGPRSRGPRRTAAPAARYNPRRWRTPHIRTTVCFHLPLCSPACPCLATHAVEPLRLPDPCNSQTVRFTVQAAYASVGRLSPHRCPFVPGARRQRRWWCAGATAIWARPEPLDPQPGRAQRMHKRIRRKLMLFRFVRGRAGVARALRATRKQPPVRIAVKTRAAHCTALVRAHAHRGPCGAR